jgi:hypothetical protein
VECCAAGVVAARHLFRERNEIPNPRVAMANLPANPCGVPRGIAGLAREPALGAHLETPRLGYRHHGVYIGGGRVVHYAGFSSRWRAGPIEEVPLSSFALGHPVRVVDHADRTYLPREVVARARSRVGERNYRLLSNNCEHFSNWCVSGLSLSAQVECPVLLALRAFAHAAGLVIRVPRRTSGRSADAARRLTQGRNFSFLNSAPGVVRAGGSMRGGTLLSVLALCGILSPVVVAQTAPAAQTAPTPASAKTRCSHQPQGSPVIPTRVFADVMPHPTTHKLENPLRPGVESALIMLAFGDSAMWGNGLSDPHKYAHLVAQFIADGTGRTVRLVTYAHSGANIENRDDCYAPTLDSDNGPPGDLNGGLPTILQQEQAASKIADYQSAELILIDGCINDVNANKVVFPLSGLTPRDVRVLAHGKCSKNMLTLLQHAKNDFPLATLIVSNYWLIISEKSSPVGIALNKSPADFSPSDRATYDQVGDLLEAELRAEKEGGRQVTDVNALRDPKATLRSWSDNSYAFLDTTETCFDWAVAVVDGKTPDSNGNDSCPKESSVAAQRVTQAVRAFLAKVPTDPEYSYGAGPKKRVWSVPGVGHRKDEVYDERSSLCKTHYDNAFDDFICHVNPAAHPNVPGADAYTKSITDILGVGWQKQPNAR